MFDLSIIVGQDMALPHDLGPWNFWVLLPKAVGDAARRFPDNLDLPLDSGTQHQVIRILLERPVPRKIGYGFGSREHIPKIRGIRLVTRHKPLDVW